jgi:hypothetical protein
MVDSGSTGGYKGLSSGLYPHALSSCGPKLDSGKKILTGMLVKYEITI